MKCLKVNLETDDRGSDLSSNAYVDVELETNKEKELLNTNQDKVRVKFALTYHLNLPHRLETRVV